MTEKNFRVEKDTLGEIKVPKHVYFGAGTKRAVDNFPISELKIPKEMVYSLVLIKKAAAIVNFKFGLIDENVKDAIVQSADEILEGKFDNQFVVDVFQTGSGTSTNMNVNEVLANRGNEILGYSLGTYTPIHPNDIVNLGQSSNDTIPSAIHIATVLETKNRLIPSIDEFAKVLEKKEKEFESILKIGRTHLQDAVPMSLGQEFSAFKASVKQMKLILENAILLIQKLAIGGTAVGTGINTDKTFGREVSKFLSKVTKVKFIETDNHFKAQSTIDDLVHFSGCLKTMATSLMKIANDIRFLSSGPRCGLGELILPGTQPGSSIMPGKINPVIAESVCQVAAKVIGNDTTVTIAGQSGNLQLNTMLPVVAYSIIQSTKLLTNAINNFSEKCIKGITVNKKVVSENIEKSLALATPLAKIIGYDKASAIAKKAYKEGKTIREVLEEENMFTTVQIKNLFKQTT